MEKLPHWSVGADPDDYRWKILRRLRDENPIVQAARADRDRFADRTAAFNKSVADAEVETGDKS